jgi:hypothetical protein
MNISQTHMFDAPVDVVWDMICNRGWRETMHTDLGHRDVTIGTLDAGPTEARIVVTAVVEAEIPGFAARVLQPANSVTSSESWARSEDGAARGRFRIEVSGVPAQLAGKTTLVPSGDRCVYSADLDLDVRIPLIGRKLASWAKDGVLEQLRAQFESGDRWLAQGRV